MNLPQGWGGVAADALRDAVHRAGDSLRPTAHALRGALPKIGGSLAPAAQAIREALPKITESFHASSSPPPKRPAWVLPACALGGLLLGIGIAVPTAKALRPGTEHAEGAVGSAPSAPSTLASPAPTEPQPGGPALSVCRTAGPPRTLAASATVGAGVEARAFGGDVAVGYAATDTEAVVLRLDPSSLSTLATITATSKGPIRRVTPVASPGGDALGLAVDVDRKNDVIRDRRTISGDPLLQVGIAGGNLVWSKRLGGPVAGKLWPLEGRADVESARGATGEVAGEAALAITFRRKNTIGIGLARGRETLSPKGKAFYFDSLGSSVGAPSVALNDGVVLAAWADRSGPEAAWSLRQVRFYAGEPPAEPSPFALPPGRKAGPAMSPSIAALPDRGFLFVWSEGPPAARGVRAVTLTGKGERVGAPLDLSSPEANAGQPQAVITSSGRGVVAYMESSGSGFHLVATPVMCGK